MNCDVLCRFQQVKSEGNRSKGLGEGDVDIWIAVVGEEVVVVLSQVRAVICVGKRQLNNVEYIILYRIIS